MGSFYKSAFDIWITLGRLCSGRSYVAEILLYILCSWVALEIFSGYSIKLLVYNASLFTSCGLRWVLLFKVYLVAKVRHEGLDYVASIQPASRHIGAIKETPATSRLAII